MRLTTKIVLGIIISIFLLSFGVIIALLFNAKRNNHHYESGIPSISQENIISINIEPYKTIWIDEEEYIDNQIYFE